MNVNDKYLKSEEETADRVQGETVAYVCQRQVRKT